MRFAVNLYARALCVNAIAYDATKRPTVTKFRSQACETHSRESFNKMLHDALYLPISLCRKISCFYIMPAALLLSARRKAMAPHNARIMLFYLVY